jgi:hypothetical protein
MTISYEFNQEQLNKFLEIPREAGIKGFKYTAAELWGLLRRVNFKTGHGALSGSWQLTKLGDFEYKVASDKEYALAVSTGTGIYGPVGQPYQIVPKTKQCLHFIWQGKEIFAKSVWIQGMKPNDYIGRSITKTESRVDEFVRKALKECGA